MIAAWVLGAALAAEPIDFGDCREDPQVEAADRFTEMLASDEATAHVALGNCFAQLGLLHTAQRHYLDVVVHSHDGNEGIASFLERRKPSWSHA